MSKPLELMTKGELAAEIIKLIGSGLQEARANKVLDLKSQGVTNTEIGKIVGMDKSVVGKVINGENKKTEHGVYFSDLTLETAL